MWNYRRYGLSLIHISPYVGMIVTSTVIGFKTEDRGKYIEVTTRNSIYTFERV